MSVKDIDLSPFSDGGIRAMHDAIRRALDADLQNPDKTDPYYGVRDTSDWSDWRDSLESEMSRRGIEFTPITW